MPPDPDPPKPKILIFGYRPFDDDVNVSELVARKLEELLGDYDKADIMVVPDMPVDHDLVNELFPHYVTDFNPDFIFCMGEDNTTRDDLRVERRAHFYDNAQGISEDVKVPQHIDNLHNNYYTDQTVAEQIEHKLSSIPTVNTRISYETDDGQCNQIHVLSQQYMKDKGTPGHAVLIHVPDPASTPVLFAYEEAFSSQKFWEPILGLINEKATSLFDLYKPGMHLLTAEEQLQALKDYLDTYKNLEYSDDQMVDVIFEHRKAEAYHYYAEARSNLESVLKAENQSEKDFERRMAQRDFDIEKAMYKTFEEAPELLKIGISVELAENQVVLNNLVRTIDYYNEDGNVQDHYDNIKNSLATGMVGAIDAVVDILINGTPEPAPIPIPVEPIAKRTQYDLNVPQLKN